MRGFVRSWRGLATSSNGQPSVAVICCEAQSKLVWLT
jgi:hypothetical protein